MTDRTYYKHHRTIDWTSLMRDYFSGMSEREIERKYDVYGRSVRWRSKKLLRIFFSDQENWNRFKEYIR